MEGVRRGWLYQNGDGRFTLPDALGSTAVLAQDGTVLEITYPCGEGGGNGGGSGVTWGGGGGGGGCGGGVPKSMAVFSVFGPSPFACGGPAGGGAIRAAAATGLPAHTSRRLGTAGSSLENRSHWADLTKTGGTSSFARRLRRREY